VIEEASRLGGVHVRRCKVVRTNILTSNMLKVRVQKCRTLNWENVTKPMSRMMKGLMPICSSKHRVLRKIYSRVPEKMDIRTLSENWLKSNDRLEAMYRKIRRERAF
jgi:hypothetical protein